MNDVLDEIQLKTRMSLPGNTLIFFDEIQEQPSLLQFLRYFYEERPDISDVAAGSLLEVALKSENFLARVQRIFAATVTQLGKKIIYQRLDANSQAREVRRTIELLLDARVLLNCIHSAGNSVPLMGESDSAIQKGEIDFLLKKGQNIIPIEVKATAAGHMKSLFYFLKEKRIEKAVKISLENFKVDSVKHRIQNEEVTCQLTTLPIWAVEQILKL